MLFCCLLFPLLLCCSAAPSHLQGSLPVSSPSGEYPLALPDPSPACKLWLHKSAELTVICTNGPLDEVCVQGFSIQRHSYLERVKGRSGSPLCPSFSALFPRLQGALVSALGTREISLVDDSTYSLWRSPHTSNAFINSDNVFLNSPVSRSNDFWNTQTSPSNDFLNTQPSPSDNSNTNTRVRSTLFHAVFDGTPQSYYHRLGFSTTVRTHTHC